MVVFQQKKNMFKSEQQLDQRFSTISERNNHEPTGGRQSNEFCRQNIKKQIRQGFIFIITV